MGMDLSYETSRLLTEKEKEMLLNEELYFEDGYSLNLITKEEAEIKRSATLYDFLINNISLEEIQANIKNIYDDLEDFLLEEYGERSELPMTFKERQNFCDSCGELRIFNLDEYEINSEKFYIVIDVGYW